MFNAMFRLLYPRERPGNHCIGGLVGPQDRSGRVRENLASHRDSIPGPSSPQRVAVPTELLRHTVKYFQIVAMQFKFKTAFLTGTNKTFSISKQSIIRNLLWRRRSSPAGRPAVLVKEANVHKQQISHTWEFRASLRVHFDLPCSFQGRPERRGRPPWTSQ